MNPTFEAVPLVAGALRLGEGELQFLGPGKEDIVEGVAVQPTVASEHLPHPPAEQEPSGFVFDDIHKKGFEARQQKGGSKEISNDKNLSNVYSSNSFKSPFKCQGWVCIESWVKQYRYRGEKKS